MTASSLSQAGRVRFSNFEAALREIAECGSALYRRCTCPVSSGLSQALAAILRRAGLRAGRERGAAEEGVGSGYQEWTQRDERQADVSLLGRRPARERGWTRSQLHPGDSPTSRGARKSVAVSSRLPGERSASSELLSDLRRQWADEGATAGDGGRCCSARGGSVSGNGGTDLLATIGRQRASAAVGAGAGEVDLRRCGKRRRWSMLPRLPPVLHLGGEVPERSPAWTRMNSCSASMGFRRRTGPIADQQPIESTYARAARKQDEGLRVAGGDADDGLEAGAGSAAEVAPADGLQTHTAW